MSLFHCVTILMVLAVASHSNLFLSAIKIFLFQIWSQTANFSQHTNICHFAPVGIDQTRMSARSLWCRKVTTTTSWWHWLSGRTSVFGQQTFRPVPDLQLTGDHSCEKAIRSRSTTRPTQPFILLGSINE